MKIHKLVVKKPFKIRNKAGHAILLPEGYKVYAFATAYQKNLIEMHKIHCQADGDKIQDDIKVWDIPCDYIEFSE